MLAKKEHEESKEKGESKDLKKNVFDFLGWVSEFLPVDKRANLEIVLSLLIMFYYQMLPDDSPDIPKVATTENYVTSLNYFTKNVLSEIRQDEEYERVFSLNFRVSIGILSCMH